VLFYHIHRKPQNPQGLQSRWPVNTVTPGGRDPDAVRHFTLAIAPPMTGNSEVIHNRDPIWETSLDSLRNQAITLTENSRLLNLCLTRLAIPHFVPHA
jgi:hypothetical protein